MNSSVTEYVESFTGEVFNGFAQNGGPNPDTLGLFGAAGADLTGVTATLKFFIDSTAGNDVAEFGGDSWQGGGATGYSNPITSASLEINGHTVTVSSLGGSEYTLNNNFFWTGSTYLDASASNPSGGLSAFVHAPNVVPIPIGLYASSGSGTGFFSQGPEVLPLQYSAVSISPAGVPEPETWFLTIVGFGGLGAALRGRAALARPSSKRPAPPTGAIPGRDLFAKVISASQRTQ